MVSEEQDEYIDPTREMKKQENMKETLVPIVVGNPGKMRKD